MFLGNRARPVLGALPPSVSRLSRQVGSLASHNPIGLHDLLRGWLHSLLFTGFGVGRSGNDVRAVFLLGMPSVVLELLMYTASEPS
jgi:hypothetical protein